MNRGRGRNPGSFSSSQGRSSIAFNSNHRHNKADGQRENLASEFGDGRPFATGRGRSSLLNSEDRFSRNSVNGTPSCYQYRPKNAQGDEIGNTSGIVARSPENALNSNSVSGYAYKTVKVQEDEISTSEASDIVAKQPKDRFSRNSGNGTPLCNQYKPKSVQGDGSGVANTSGIAKLAESAESSNSVSGYASKTKVVQQDEISTPKSTDIVTKQPRNAKSCNLVSRGDPLMSSSCWGGKEVQLVVTRIQAGERAGERARGEATLPADFSAKLDFSHQQNESRLHMLSPIKENLISNKGSFYNTEGTGDSEHLEPLSMIQPFDLFLFKPGASVMLKPSLLVKNRERRNEIKRANEGLNGSILRPGMVLLKSYLSIQDQAKIVKLCRDLGLGPGGFYQPQYHDGARLYLKMMCLGKNWDPDKSEYVERRPIDGAKPPAMPHECYPLVEKAIRDAHALIIQRDSKRSHVEDILPRMSPNLCIVNFYSSTGRLGLHQDKDESQESLRKRLPVVSFSIGDSGEFLYGDERNVDKAEKVRLDSGDVLIFGGKSRHVFHGVSSVLPNTAPKALLDETNLRPGRLNLTFREY